MNCLFIVLKQNVEQCYTDNLIGCWLANGFQEEREFQLASYFSTSALNKIKFSFV